jgi:hypothetical protein
VAVYRVVMVQSIPSINMTFENAVGFRTRVDGVGSAAGLATDIQANFMVMIQNFQSNFLGWQSLYVYDWHNPDTPPAFLNLGNSPGLAGVGYMYPTLCMKLKWIGVTGGRHGRGRFYIAGGRADWTTAGGVNGTGLTNGSVWANNIKNRYSSTGTGPYVLSILPKRPTELTEVQMASVQFPQILGQIRRRNYGVGI